MAKTAGDLNRILYPFLPLALIVFFIPLSFFLGKFPTAPLLGAGAFCFFLFDGMGVQIGVHKLMSHRSFQSSVAVKRILAFLSVLSGQGSPLVWVAIHSGSHHKFTDTEKDLHSPIRGKFYAFLGWYWQCDTTKVNFLNAREFIKDPWLSRIHQHHTLILLVYWGFLALTGLDVLVALGLLPALVSIVLAGFVNSFMHSEGAVSKVFFLKYKNYFGDSTYNSWWLGLLTMGLGLHNNHHQRPGEPVYSHRWWEIDLSKFIIPLLRRF